MRPGGLGVGRAIVVGDETPKSARCFFDWSQHMRYKTIRSHLKPYVIVSRRKTTINHAFAASIAPSEAYDEKRVREAVAVLGQDPEKDLLCAYCRAPAQTWDHVFATVKNSSFSGYGHRLGNLLPCCKPCNSAKGNKEWKRFLVELELPAVVHQTAVSRIDAYLSTFSFEASVPVSAPEYERFLQIRADVLKLLSEADLLATRIRDQAVLRRLK
jgi:5-methylcytosine-specific restriction endonuclease McrA